MEIPNGSPIRNTLWERHLQNQIKMFVFNERTFMLQYTLEDYTLWGYALMNHY